MRHCVLFTIFGLVPVLGLAACDGDPAGLDAFAFNRDGGVLPPADGGPGADDVEITGTITGLTGTGLVLQNGADEVTVPKQVSGFRLAARVKIGTAYDVKVKTQPAGPSQTCTVKNGAGTAAARVTNIEVACVTNAYPVHVNVVGAGEGLVLQNGAEELAVPAGTAKATFATSVESGKPFAVTVKTQPTTPPQHCSVAGGSGTVLAGPVETVTVNCTTRYAIGGTVTGLIGTGLVLVTNGEEVPVNAVGEFAFPTPVIDGGDYAVTVKTHPTSPWQTCTVTDGGGKVAGAAVTSVAVACTTNRYAVTANVTGLAGAGLVLTNGGEDLAVAAAGAVPFPTTVESGAEFDVKVKANPANPWQTCTVTNGKAVMAGANAIVNVACERNRYAVQAKVVGLKGKGLVVRFNGNALAPIDADGTVAVGTVESGAGFAFEIATAPNTPTQNCRLVNGAGTVGGTEITTIVSCASVLCLGATSPQAWLDDVRTKLVATDAFEKVDVYNAYLTGTPTLALLQEYTSVLAFSDYGFQDPNAVGNHLADYFDGGGRVVIATFANASVPVGGRWASGGYGLFVTGGQLSNDSQGALTFDEPLSPLVSGVNTLTSTSSYRTNGAPVDGAVVVARWGHGAPLVVRGVKNGRPYASLNMYPPSATVRSDFWVGDGANLMRNALLY